MEPMGLTPSVRFVAQVDLVQFDFSPKSDQAGLLTTRRNQNHYKLFVITRNTKKKTFSLKHSMDPALIEFKLVEPNCQT